jgi:hypothetical protein
VTGVATEKSDLVAAVENTGNHYRTVFAMMSALISLLLTLGRIGAIAGGAASGGAGFTP